jgi:hypothetical protein
VSHFLRAAPSWQERNAAIGETRNNCFLTRDRLARNARPIRGEGWSGSDGIIEPVLDPVQN